MPSSAAVGHPRRVGLFALCFNVVLMVVLLALARLALERDYYSDALAMFVVFVWLLYIPLWTVIVVALTAAVLLWGERRTSGRLATGLRWTGNALGWTSAVFGVTAACFVALSIILIAFM